MNGNERYPTWAILWLAISSKTEEAIFKTSTCNETLDNLYVAAVVDGLEKAELVVVSSNGPVPSGLEHTASGAKVISKVI